MKRRVYYDHEPVYRQVAQSGGCGWDDACPGSDSYAGLRSFIAEYRGHLESRAILDLGCGGGQAALIVAPLAERVVGIDYSETAIAIARTNTREALNVRCEVGDCTAPSVPSASFGAVLDNHTLHCLVLAEHRRSFLAHARRALVGGGLLFSETMSSEGGFEPSAFDVPEGAAANRSRTRIWVSQRQLDAELESAGFRVVARQLRPQDDEPNPGDLIWTVAAAE